jgi:2',3'-cyclic-nucleotide 2'-phosphodiesterase (5'-nucleotidase family)
MTRLLLAAFAALAGGVLSYSIPRAQADLRGPPELPVPTRPLEWGDINFLSTSDTHGEAHAGGALTAGWLRGHQHVRHC